MIKEYFLIIALFFFKVIFSTYQQLKYFVVAVSQQFANFGEHCLSHNKLYCCCSWYGATTIKNVWQFISCGWLMEKCFAMLKCFAILKSCIVFGKTPRYVISISLTYMEMSEKPITKIRSLHTKIKLIYIKQRNKDRDFCLLL